MKIQISNSSIKRCKTKFDYKGIGKVINRACNLFEKIDVEVIISECIYDTDDPMIYNVLLYLIRENCTDKKILDELSELNYEMEN